MRNALIATTAFLAACAAEEGAGPAPIDDVLLSGTVPAELDPDLLTEDFAESGAEFGVVVDPTTGDVAMLEYAPRAVNSSDFAQGSASCIDCNPACASLGRSLQIRLNRTAGSSIVGVQVSSATNYSLVSTTCDPDGYYAYPEPCPHSTAVSAPDGIDIFLDGNMATCALFTIYFDTTDGT